MSQTVLERYVEILDNRPEEIYPLLSPDLEFCVVYSKGQDDVAEFSGGRAELEGYFRQREPDGQLHHIDMAMRVGRTETVFGHTTRHEEPLATFTMAADLDEQDRITHLYCSRSTSLQMPGLFQIFHDHAGQPVKAEFAL